MGYFDVPHLSSSYTGAQTPVWKWVHFLQNESEGKCRNWVCFANWAGFGTVTREKHDWSKQELFSQREQMLSAD